MLPHSRNAQRAWQKLMHPWIDGPKAESRAREGKWGHEIAVQWRERAGRRIWRAWGPASWESVHVQLRVEPCGRPQAQESTHRNDHSLGDCAVDSLTTKPKCRRSFRGHTTCGGKRSSSLLSGMQGQPYHQLPGPSPEKT